MQTVWSKVAQRQCICNCPSCLRTTNPLARRATTATARRTLRVGDVFTASLSSLAAGLAIADSRKKDDRRKQWDKVIAEARATVEATELQQQSRLAALSDDAKVEAIVRTRASQDDISAESSFKDVEDWDSQQNEEQDQMVPITNDTSDTWLDVFDWAQEQHKIREASGFQDWKGPPLGLLQSLSKAQLDELLSDGRLLRRFYGGPDCNSLVDEQSKYPLSKKKLRTLEWSVAKLVLHLLSYCSKNSLQSREDPSCPTKSLLRKLLKREKIESRLEYTRERLRTLHADSRDQRYYENFEAPEFPIYEDITLERFEQRTHMNLFLQKLLVLMKSNRTVNDFMPKICYNLLAARAPPNTHTYNMLLVRFCVLGNKDLVRVVLTSMRETHIRPNEITHATLLRYYTATRDGTEFFHYWRRMEGYQQGLALANPEHPIHPVVKERHLLFGASHHKAAEKARMNGQVYESLIVGALQFFTRITAMQFYRNMISEGWSPSLGILLAILQDCCHRLDWAVGSAVIEQIGGIKERLDTLAYEWMLRLCQYCGKQESFDHILLNGVYCGALPASMLDLPDHAKAEDVAFLIERAKDLQPRKTSGNLESTAARISHRLHGGSFLLENALGDCEDEDKQRNTINRINDRWKVSLALEERLDVISTEIKHTTMQANDALYMNGLEHISSVKFWLSEHVKRLEEEQQPKLKGDRVPHASYNDLVQYDKVQIAQASKVGVGKGQHSNLVRLPLTVSFPGNESKYSSRPTSGEERQQGSPSLLPMVNPPDDSFRTCSGEQVAATA